MTDRPTSERRRRMRPRTELRRSRFAASASQSPTPAGGADASPTAALAAAPAVCATRGSSMTHAVLLVLLLVVGVGPLLLLAKSAITPTQDIIRTPLAIFPHGVRLGELSEAWNDVHIGQYFLNTIWLAAGSWFVQMLVATTARLRAVRAAARLRQDRQRPRARDAVRAERRAARAAVPHDPQPAGASAPR